MPVWRPRRRSARCWSSGRRTRPCTPVRRIAALLEQVLVLERDLAPRAAAGAPLPSPRGTRARAGRGGRGAGVRRWTSCGSPPSGSIWETQFTIGGTRKPQVTAIYRLTASRTAIGYKVNYDDHCYPAPLRRQPRSADDDHEQIVIRQDPATGLRFIVAVHSTVLGPALGGMRLKRYPGGLREALDDVMGLARTMTLKASAAGLDLGGGKAVMIDDGRRETRQARLEAAAGGDRRARRRLHHRRGHRHHHRRHGPPGPLHAASWSAARRNAAAAATPRRSPRRPSSRPSGAAWPRPPARTSSRAAAWA